MMTTATEGTGAADATTGRGLARTTFGRVLMIAGVGAALVAGAGCVSSPPQPPQRIQQQRAVAAPKGEPPREPLSPVVQGILKRRMVSHAADMNDLVSAIMILDYPRIDDRAEKIAGDASLSRPLSGDATELNSSLPEQFFVYQDQVKAEARGLAEAARAQDPYQVAAKYGRLSESCVRCHADYRPRG